jgi:exodeoxyribonuclease V beta subunit
VRDALLRLRVPCIQQVQESVFASAEAEAMSRLLRAIAEPGQDALVRAALITDLFGVTADDLEALAADESAWDQRLETFRADHERWRTRGLLPTLRDVFRREGVAPRLLRFPDGERRLTNLYHLAELLHAEDARAPGMGSLIRWLADRRTVGGGSEEAQLRLESDEHLVKIATIHKSKGLQYPIVFCPFLWDGRIQADADERILYHDPAAAHRPTLDLGSGRRGAARAQARREELAENLRLAYVALTRARHRVYVAWGHVKDGDTAPLAYLLHQPADLGTDPMAALAQRMASLGSDGIRADLDRLVQASGDTVALAPMPLDPPPPFEAEAEPGDALAARLVTRAVAAPWRIASYTALAREAAAEGVDDDADTPGPAAERPGPTEFPRGARAGQCLHALLQRLDFAAPARPDPPVVAQVLALHGFDAGWRPAAAALIRQVLECPLDRGLPGLRLSAISRAARLDELEFLYPVRGVTDAGLRRLLATHGYGTGTRIADEVAGLTFAPVEGFMRGYVDLVFEWAGKYYLVDYKSNWLGTGAEAYREDRLAGVMAREGYYLQSLLYLAALHRYLGQRQPAYRYETHVGGVYYLFLRGLDPARGPASGVYRDRPRPPVIAALDRYLAGEGP